MCTTGELYPSEEGVRKGGKYIREDDGVLLPDNIGNIESSGQRTYTPTAEQRDLGFQKETTYESGTIQDQFDRSREDAARMRKEQRRREKLRDEGYEFHNTGNQSGARGTPGAQLLQDRSDAERWSRYQDHLNSTPQSSLAINK